MLGKYRLKKVKKQFFIHKNIVTKKIGGKNARNNFSRNTQWCDQKMLGKYHRKYVRTSVFLIFTQTSLQKMVEKKRETIFPETHKYVPAKMLGKKS